MDTVTIIQLTFGLIGAISSILTIINFFKKSAPPIPLPDPPTGRTRPVSDGRIYAENYRTKSWLISSIVIAILVLLLVFFAYQNSDILNQNDNNFFQNSTLLAYVAIGLLIYSLFFALPALSAGVFLKNVFDKSSTDRWLNMLIFLTLTILHILLIVHCKDLDFTNAVQITEDTPSSFSDVATAFLPLMEIITFLYIAAYLHCCFKLLILGEYTDEYTRNNLTRILFKLLFIPGSFILFIYFFFISQQL